LEDLSTVKGVKDTKTLMAVAIYKENGELRTGGE